MKQPFKKIAVCHGPTCGPHGAKKLQHKLEEAYAGSGVDITARECCGRCENHNTIVIDDSTTISRLDEETISAFIADPTTAMEQARREEKELSEKIDDFLSSEDLV